MDELTKCRDLNKSLCGRIAACSEALSRAAERDGNLKRAIHLMDVLCDVKRDILLVVERGCHADALLQTVAVIDEVLEGK